MSYTIFEDGHISSPMGFRSTGVAAGLKEARRARDLALIYSQYPCKAAALFTTNIMRAAPVYFDQAILGRNRENIRAVLINAGQANAGTGQPGLADAVECAKITADELEIPRDGVLLMSTGIVGVPLPMNRMRLGIRRAASELDSGGGRRAALAIMTTDTRPKERAFHVQLREGRRITLAGMAKGTRQIHPKLATLLCVITTDLSMDVRLLQRSLQQSVSKSFARLNIDGDSSTNDTILLLANGAAEGMPITDSTSREFGAWQEALDALTADLAQQIIRDATGTGKMIQIQVRGAADEAQAAKVADKIAGSAGVRRACVQGEADWGALLTAVGSSETELRPDLLELRIGNIPVLLEGAAVEFDAAQVAKHMSGPEIEFTVDMHMGIGSTVVWTCTWSGEGV
jgi:glutamate N-acetyltransferase/amino-acid acetyltransferase